MRLLIYIHSLEAGGAERVTASLANYWAKRGWQITIATVESIHRDFYYLDPAVQRIGFNLQRKNHGLQQTVTCNFARIGTLRKAIRATKPDAVMAMMTNANIILALACRGLPHLCAVGSERTNPAQDPIARVWGYLRRFCYRGLDAVVALTPECAEWIMRNTFAAAAPVIPNPAVWPLDAQAPYISPETACRPGRKVLLGVGRLCQAKDFSTLIKVFGELAGHHPDWDLVITGTGPEHERLSEQIKALGLCERVFLPGVVGNLGEWYGRSDLYVMTSRYEGFPNSLAEALAHGLPAVSFDCDTGPRDIIRNGLDGLLVAPGDVDALRLALDRMMGDNVLRLRFAERSVEARERFSIERVAGLWEALFRKESSVFKTSRAYDQIGT
jgi:glycosyltransferase involved in cell wall biosynthesis